MLYNCQKCNCTPRPHTPSIYSRLSEKMKEKDERRKKAARRLYDEQQGWNILDYHPNKSKAS